MVDLVCEQLTAHWKSKYIENMVITPHRSELVDYLSIKENGPEFYCSFAIDMSNPATKICGNRIIGELRPFCFGPSQEIAHDKMFKFIMLGLNDDWSSPSKPIKLGEYDFLEWEPIGPQGFKKPTSTYYVSMDTVKVDFTYKEA